jgi:hypothetical protein
MDSESGTAGTERQAPEMPPVSGAPAKRWPVLRLRDPDPEADRFAEIGPDHPLYLLGERLSRGVEDPDLRYDLLLAARANWPLLPGRRWDASAEVAAQVRQKGVPVEQLERVTGLDRRGVRKRITAGNHRLRQRKSHPIPAPLVEVVGYTTTDLEPRFRALMPRVDGSHERWSRAIEEISPALCSESQDGER